MDINQNGTPPPWQKLIFDNKDQLQDGRQSVQRSSLDDKSVGKQVEQLEQDLSSQQFDRVSLSSSSGFYQKPYEKGLGQAVSFLKDFVSIESQEGDSEGAKVLAKAIDVLEKIDQPITTERRTQEIESKRFVGEYVQLLHETDAPAGITANFEHLLGVFNALDQSRLQELQTNATASYASVQQFLNQNGYE